MKGHEKVIEQLNARLAEELTAINQYMVHAEMCENWKYEHLGEAIEKRAIAEMKHAETLIDRILYLDGRPIVSTLNKISIGPEVKEMHENDLDAEIAAVKGYNESIKIARDVGDDGTAEILKSILRDEEDHVDWLEAQFDQIKQTGIENYLAAQMY
jgi:bacterioferritin